MHALEDALPKPDGPDVLLMLAAHDLNTLKACSLYPRNVLAASPSTAALHDNAHGSEATVSAALSGRALLHYVRV